MATDTEPEPGPIERFLSQPLDGNPVRRFAWLIGVPALIAAAVVWATQAGQPCHPQLGCYWWPLLSVGLASVAYLAVPKPGPAPAAKSKTKAEPKTEPAAGSGLSLTHNADGHLVRVDTETGEFDPVDTTDEMDIIK